MFTSFINRAVSQISRQYATPAVFQFRGFTPASRQFATVRSTSTPQELLVRWEKRYTKVTDRLQTVDERLAKLATYKPRTEKTVQSAQERLERYSATKEKLLEEQKRALTFLTRYQNRINRDNIRSTFPSNEEIAKMNEQSRLQLLSQDPSIRSGYSLFTREYHILHPGSKFGDFTQAWRNLNQADKARYNEVFQAFRPPKPEM